MLKVIVPRRLLWKFLNSEWRFPRMPLEGGFQIDVFLECHWTTVFISLLGLEKSTLSFYLFLPILQEAHRVKSKRYNERVFVIFSSLFLYRKQALHSESYINSIDANYVNFMHKDLLFLVSSNSKLAVHFR